ncbi:MAG: Ulilysin [Spirosoma sp.]|nr:Ulilysin [Spirosoma sp.]
MIMQASKSGYSLFRTGWRWLAGSFLSVLTLATNAQTTSVEEAALQRCGTVEYERVLQQRNPNRLRQLNELNRQLEQVEANRMLLRQADDQTIYRIPVVVHVVHNMASGEIGGITNGNISDEQIASQIQVLNEDYRRQPGTNGFNTNPVGADARIEFFLATKDPAGQPTTGITRHYYAKKASFDVFNDDVLLSQIAYWPSDRYLNIWVTKVDSYLGFTQFPTTADTLSGLPANSNEFVDGSIIDYRYFGRQIGTVRNSTYCCGRTTTHEIGHWLGLLHTWGDAVCGNDYVTDTPTSEGSNQTVNCKEIFSTCSGRRTRNMIENFMDYSPDLCMNVFTQGQVNRMRTVLNLSPRRFRLIQAAMTPLGETEKLTINVYPNPVVSDVTVDVQLKGFQSYTVDILDLAGRKVKTSSYADSPSTRVLLSTNQLATGIYIIRVKTASESVSSRLLVE